jgi:hypothetical protein
MSDILDRIKADYDSKKMRKVDVPEWGAVIFFNPLTLAERKRIGSGHDATDEAAIMVSLIMEKALDGEGFKIFAPGAATRATLEGGSDAAVVSRVVMAMGAAEKPADAKKD